MDNEVREHYNNLAEEEWARMDASPYMQLVYMLHLDFIREELRPGIKILDAGGGSGRYTAELLKRGCDVTLLDISDKELEFAKKKHKELGVCASAYINADIRDMHMLPNEEFDLTLCYGAPLSYCLTGREAAAGELYRVTKPGGTVAVSVNATWGIFLSLYGSCNKEFFSNPVHWHIDKVAQTGDLPKMEEVPQPARHFFSPEDLVGLMKNAGLHDVLLGAAPCLSCANKDEFAAFCENETAYQTIINLELKSYRNQYLAGCGEFLMAKGTK